MARFVFAPIIWLRYVRVRARQTTYVYSDAGRIAKCYTYTFVRCNVTTYEIQDTHITSTVIDFENLKAIA